MPDYSLSDFSFSIDGYLDPTLWVESDRIASERSEPPAEPAQVQPDGIDWNANARTQRMLRNLAIQCYTRATGLRRDACEHCRTIYSFALANPTGYDSEGYDYRGYDHEGFNRDGYNNDGYDREGYDSRGYSSLGYDREGYDRNGCDRNGYDRNGEYRPHEDDEDDERGDTSSLYNYSYTPNLQFRGEKPPFYGMEIEVTSDYPNRVVRACDQYAGRLIYCKEDGSVDGAEMVTHPMTYDWAMENFPWDLLPALREEADATTIADENGIHIHVGRDGFDGSAHMYRWMKLWYRNPSDIRRIARRSSGQWAGFRPDHRRGHAMAVKRGKLGYDYYRDTTASERYSAINTTNDATLEVRVFASSLRPQRVQAALGLVAGSVEYTRQLTAADVAQRKGWTWESFITWAEESGKYPALIEENKTRR